MRLQIIYIYICVCVRVCVFVRMCLCKQDFISDNLQRLICQKHINQPTTQPACNVSVIQSYWEKQMTTSVLLFVPDASENVKHVFANIQTDLVHFLTL